MLSLVTTYEVCYSRSSYAILQPLLSPRPVAAQIARVKLGTLQERLK